MCYPFASVYRSIIAVNPNKHIKTIFTSKPLERVLTEGDVMAFDFNREVHRIEMVEGFSSNAIRDQRYALKVHYLVYPSALPYYGYLLAWLTSTYDQIARRAFCK
jgi:hypothetical protein